MSKILIVNAGSSSIKLSLLDKETLHELASGLAERIGLQKGKITFQFQTKVIKELPLKNHHQGVEEFLKIFHEVKLVKDLKEISYLGFRIVMGGPKLTKSAIITPQVISEIEKYAPFAPVHNPGALETIKAFQKALPEAKMSASFDTAFHTTIPLKNSLYALPQEWYQEYQVKKYGFHGLSHHFITTKMQELLGKEKVNIVNLHIGNGASLCAIKNSQSFDTSMGLTPLAGVVMGTRSGDVDPAIVPFMAQTLEKDAAEIVDLLNKKSGLLGLSKISSDLRDINSAAEENDPNATLALDIYVKASVDYLVNYLNKIGPKVDAITFTAGVGENDNHYRQRVIEGVKLINLEIDEKVNNSRVGEYALISTKNSAIPIYVVRTNEELVIAQDALKLH